MGLSESMGSAFSLEFRHVNNTSGNKTPYLLLLVVPREFCSVSFQALHLILAPNCSVESEICPGVGTRSQLQCSLPELCTLQLLLPKPFPLTGEFTSSLPCWSPRCMGLVRGEQGVIFMKRGLGVFLPPCARCLSLRALMILLLFLKLQPNLLKPFSLMTNLNMAHWELRKGTTTSSLVASVR